MPTSKRIIEPSNKELFNWFQQAKTGDRCDVVTRQGQLYTQITKCTPTMVKWKVSGFTGQDIYLGKTIYFGNLLKTWGDFATP